MVCASFVLIYQIFQLTLLLQNPHFWSNPIPLDETIDAVYSVGRMLPRELKVTALGGLALAPSALGMPRLRG